MDGNTNIIIIASVNTVVLNWSVYKTKDLRSETQDLKLQSINLGSLFERCENITW